MSISVRLRWVLVAAFAIGTLVFANPFPGLWGNGAGAAVHFQPVAWPSEPANPVNCGANCGDWKPYTRFRNPIGDARTQDPSNGGTAPQSYVNVASSCTDKSAPSVYYYLHRGATPADDVIMFRWRVESAAHNYATGPSPGNYGASSPWSSAQWTVFFDVGGSGYRTLAAHLNGSSGSPAEPVDMLVGIWSNTPNQSIDYADPNVLVLGHNPTAFVGPSNRLMNFHGTLSPDESWPNGAAETQWDYGTTRAKLVSSSPCSEYFVDYQIPVAMLDATSVGGPAITRDTPISMLFCTANSLTNPFQKDCAINRQWTADAARPAPFGDYLSFNRPEPYQQPIVSAVSATPPASCPGNYSLNSTVQDTLAVQSGVVTHTVKSVKFFYWYDRNGDGLANAADTGSEWISASAATLKSGTLNAWQASWNAGALAKGKYLIGVQAVDDNTLVDDGATPSGIDNRTFSYLSGDTDSEIYIGNAWKSGQQASFPAHSPVQTPSGTENWYGNPSVTGLQVALVGTAINACGVAPTIELSSTPASVAAGGSVAYTVTLANPSANSQAETFSSVSATLPSGFSYVNASTSGTNGLPSTNPTVASQTLTWTPGAPLSLSPGQSATLAFSATAGSTPGVYSVTAFSASSFGTLTSSPASTTVDSARLSLSMTPGAYSIAADGATSLVYTLRYANDSGVGVTAASITSVLPAHVNYVGCSGGSLCSNAAGTVTWTLGSIAANSSGTVTLTVNVANTITTFSLANSATLSATPPGGGTVSASASATVAVTGVAVSGSAAFTLVKTASAATMAPGGSITYTLSYQNYGSASGSGVSITDTLPSGMSFGSCSASCSQGSGTVTWNLGTVAAGGSGSVTVTLTAATPFTASNPATNNASLMWSGGTPVNASVSTGITGQACSIYYYRNTTANVGNAGTQRIANVSPVPVSGDTGSSVTVTAPVSGSAYLEAVRFYQDPATSNDVPFDGNITSNIYIDRANGQGLNVQATVYDYNSATGGTTQLAQQNTLFNGSTKGLLSTTITPSGTLANGHRLLWVYQVRSNHNSLTVQVQFQFGGTVTNAISGGSTFADSNASYCVTPPANLTLAKRVSSASIVEATTPTLKYTLSYANSGSASANNTSLVAQLPTGFTSCEYSTNDSTWANCSSLGSSPQSHTFSLGTLGGSATGNVYVRGTVPAGTTAGNVLTATSTLDSDQTTALNASASTNVAAAGSVAVPALSLSLSADRSTVAPGGAVVYTATVVNTGSGTANNVVVSNALPVSAYYTYGGCFGSCGVVAGTATWPTISSLAPGASQSFTYSMNVGTSGLPAGVTLLGDDLGATGDSSLSATSNTVTVAVNGNPSLGLLNNVAPTVNVHPGTELTYTITLSNGGAANAGGVVVANPVPANTDYVGNLSAGQGSASFDAVNNRVLFDVGTLASGSSVTLSFRARVRSPLNSGNTLISSTATATSFNAPQQIDSAVVTASASAVLALTQTAPASVTYPSTTLSSASAGTVLLVDRTDRLQVNQLVQVNGQVARVVSMTARTLTVDSLITAAGGAPVVGAAPVTLTYRNDGDADATGVQVRESLHSAFGYNSATPAATSSPIVGNGGDVDWNVGTVGAGENATLEVQTFPTGASGSFLNMGSVTATNATTVNASTVTAVGGLTFAKSTSTPTASAGGVATYTIIASNSLGSPVSPVSVIDSLPNGFSYRPATATVGGVSTEPTFDASDTGSTQPTWAGLSIPAGGTLVIVFQADVAAVNGAGVYQNELAVSAPSGAGVMLFDPLLSSVEDVTVLAAASGVLKGYVFQRPSGNSLSFDPANDTPLGGVRVQIHKSGADCTNPVGDNCFVVDTDSNGYFERVVPAESWIVSVIPATGALPGGWYQIAGANDDSVTVPDQGSITDYNGFSSAAPPSYLVSTSAGANGSLSPASQTVVDGATTAFTVTPDSGYLLSSVSGCSGSLAGGTYTTGAIAGACTVTASFVSASVPTHNVTSTAAGGGGISPASAVVADGSTTSFTVTPDVGQQIVGVTGCGGNLSGNTYTTGAITNACAVSATFSPVMINVTTSAGANGAIAPGNASVVYGGTTSFTVTPDSGYDIASVAGCGGSLAGNSYTTGSITSACAVSATFISQGVPSFLVTSAAGSGGSVTPGSVLVASGSATSFAISPDPGHSIAGAAGCGGSLNGNTYTTGPVTAACAVSATFSANSYTVTSSAGAGGSITPPSQSVTHGSTTSFTLTPATGYSIDTVSGCSGDLSGNSYTTGAVTGACSVSATFSNNNHAVTASAGAGGSVTPASQLVTEGATGTITITPDAGHAIGTVLGCGGSLSGDTFITGPITTVCSVSATFTTNSYTVTSSAGSGGSITPPSRSVTHGATTTFAITPDADYATTGVTGCGGSLSGNTYTTAAITAACAVSATFSRLGPSFDPAPPARINARALTADVPTSIAPAARDANGNPLAVILVGESRLRPGRHLLTWRAVDAQGRESTTQQQFDVWPMISAGNDLTVGFGSDAAFAVVLNGDSPEYPFAVAFEVSGPGFGSLHNLASGTATFTSGTEVAVNFNALPQGTSMPVQHLTVSLDPAANLGARTSLDIALISANEAPRATIVTTQSTRVGDLVAQDGGPVTLRVDIEDPNPADTHVVAWTVPAGLTVQTSSDGRSITFDPTRFNVGISKFDVQVTDSGTPRLSSKASRQLAVRAASLVLGVGDANGNGVSDTDEGWGDSGNGIPVYLSRDSSRQVLPEDAPVTDRYLVEGPPDQALRVGVYALLNGGNGARIDTEIVYGMTARDVVANVGGIFSVDAWDLGSPNGAVMVIPQRAAIPANAVYRLWDPKNNRWMTFVENGVNHLASAPGTPGYCPTVGSSAYLPGLRAGDLCVQVTIEDGGPNDGDAQKDGAMTSLGGVAQRVEGVVTGSSQGGSGGGGAVGIEILGLMMLVALRLARKRSTWMAPLLIGPLIANGAEPSDVVHRWYAGLSVVSVHNSDGAAEMDRRLAAEGYTTTTTLSGQHRFGGSLFAGCELGRFSFELGYVTLGRMDSRINGSTPLDDIYLGAISRAHPRSGEGPQAALLATLPLSDRFELFGRAGLFYWKNLQTARSGGQSVHGTDRRLDPMVSLGVSYHPGSRWSLRAAAELYRLEDQKVTTLQLGIVRRLGNE
ncbi:MAG: hypothetical protein ABI821_02550 [Pseudomonadota bacterium]